MLLNLKNIYKNYGKEPLIVPVLKDVSLEVVQGDYVAIMGPSGSGKTTLMNIIGCLDRASSGTYLFEDEDISEMNDDALSDLRLNKIGFVFQMRDPYRDDCGILVSDSKNIRFQNMTVHYMHEMGLMVQNSEDIFTDGFNCLPGAGRTASVSSDIMHFSGCRGTVRIENGCFVGAHDDAINIHGTHLQVMKNENGFVTLQFMHK